MAPAHSSSPRNPMQSSSRWLTAAAVLCFGIALLHVAIIFMGPEGYTYFGAPPELARHEARGSIIPDLAGRMRRLPLLRLGLVVIGAVFTLRGLALFVQLAQMVSGTATAPPRMAVFSLVSLITGVAFLAGTIPRWRTLA